jgi:phosphatidylglycerophosphate synthase
MTSEGEPAGLAWSAGGVHDAPPWRGDRQVRAEPGAYSRPARTREERERAEQAVLASLGKPTDGALAGRRWSVMLSRRLAPYPVSPNLITLATLAAAAGAAALTALGTYWSVLAGTLAYALTSILDGVDGEIARMKFLTSSAGEWLDTVCDDLANLFYLTGLTVGLSRPPTSAIWTGVGTAAVALTALTVAIMYYRLATRMGGRSLLAFQAAIENRAARGLAVPLERWLAPLVKRDTYAAAFTLFAVLAVPHLTLLTTAAATTGVLVYLLSGRDSR